MTYTSYPGLITSVEPGSLAAQLGLQPGDELLAVNGHGLRDVIDAQFYAAEDRVSLRVRRAERTFNRRGARAAGVALGLTFAHPTFDIDIRRCNNLCPFCFVLQMPARMRRTLYIKDDDYRYSFLYGHFVTLTNLSDSDWARIAEQRLSPLYVSVHATELDVRRAALRNADAPDVLAQLRWLRDHGITAHTQLVVTPGLNDGAHLERSLDDLAALYPAVQSVSVVPVGITRHHKYGHRPNTRAESEAVVAQVTRRQRRFKRELGTRFAFLTDEWYLQTGRSVPGRAYYEGLQLQENGLGMVRDFLEDWKKVRREIERRRAAGELRGMRGRRVVLATGTLFAPVLAQVAREFAAATGTRVTVVPVTNDVLGATITVAGLLMGADLVRALHGHPADVTVLPRIAFDHPDGITLDDRTPAMIARALGRPVALADALGDVLDALLGQNALVFAPDAPAGDVPPSGMQTPVVHEGGWAVEKYL
jgi:putative radical SAM enzyme (TIGR03279 family)